MVVHIICIIIIVFLWFRHNPYYILIDVRVQDDITIRQWGKKNSKDKKIILVVDISV